MRYFIKRLPDDVTPAFEGAFAPESIPEPYSSLDEAGIARYPWGREHAYPAFARVGWNDTGLYVLMYARESPVIAKETRPGGEQYKDSCMEFFFQPFEDNRYINIEFNSLGIAHVGVGEGRHGRRVFYEAIPGMDARALADGPYWAVNYRVPASFLHELYGECLSPGLVMRGNFYKCSLHIHPHYGTWSPVIAPAPDFHRPECFGEMALMG